jgi:UDP-2,4-diacetamido-2,4,6-trideoxy-beta-L-altropyranose hydrolase
MLVRLAEQQDCDDILNWRNDVVTRSVFYEGGLVEYTSHKVWFDKTLNDEQQVLTIGFEGKDKVGVVRYDNDEEKIEVSINLNPIFRGKGLGPGLLTETEKMLPQCWRSLSLLAEIKSTNTASISTFERAGYSFVENAIRHGHGVCIYKRTL